MTVIEVAGSGIHWMEPQDLRIEELTRRSNHPGGTEVLFADGTVRFVSEMER